MKWLSVLFDSSDCRVETHDVLAFLAFSVLIGLQVWAMWRGEVFDVASFGQAVGIVIGGGAAGAVGTSFLRRAVRGGNQPKPDNPDEV